jgi:hypothetical protein
MYIALAIYLIIGMILAIVVGRNRYKHNCYIVIVGPRFDSEDVLICFGVIILWLPMLLWELFLVCTDQ